MGRLRSIACVVLVGCGPTDVASIDNTGGESFVNPYGTSNARLDQTPNATITPRLSIACSDWNGTNENSWYRIFPLKDFGVTGPFTVYRVNFAVQTAQGPDQRVKVSVGTYAGTAGSVELDPTKIDVLGLTTLPVLEGSDQLMQANFAGFRMPADSNLIVEIKSEGWGDGRYFYLGATEAPEMMPGYLRAPTCNTPNPVMTNALGYSQSHLIISVSGSY